jgi:peroxiredoxin Q/BCP
MAKALKDGDAAPEFELESDSGKKVSVPSGKWTVVYFYPRDDTPGCTREAQGFSAAIGELERAGASVVGISKDSIASHCSFRDKYKLKFALLSDPDLAVHKAYGAYGDKVMYGKRVKGVIRSTFLVSPKGEIARAWPSVKVDGHVDAVLEELKKRT